MTQDEPVFVDKDANAKCQKVEYINGVVVLHDEQNIPSIQNIDKNQLLVQYQAQAVAKLKRALSFCTMGNKMTIRGQIGIKISMLLNDVLKVAQHKTKLLAILDKLRHLDKRAMEVAAESEKLHKALYYYYQSLVAGEVNTSDTGGNNNCVTDNNADGKSEDKVEAEKPTVEKKLGKLPSNYLEELLNLEVLHMACETIMETKIKLTEQIINFLYHQCAIMDKIIPENLCKAIEIILCGKDKKCI